MAEIDFALMRRHPLYQGLAAPAFERLREEARVVPYGKGQVIFLAGDPADRLFFLSAGWLKVFRDSAEGAQSVLHVVGPGESFAEPAALALKRYPASAEAVSDLRLVELPAEFYREILRETPDLAFAVIGSLALRLRSLTDDLSRRELMPTRLRLAAFLLELLGDGEGATDLTLPFDKALIAARIGMKPESLSRAFASLRELGVETQGAKVSITDPARLRDLIDDA